MAATLTAIHVICITYLVAVRGVMGRLCEEKGECGLNGICKLDGDSSTCICPPGFHLIDTKNASKGCLPNTSPQLNKCGVTATMESVGHYDWSGNDYKNLNPINETACVQACLEDCFCTVAIYAIMDSVGNCWKKALPLIDGRASGTRSGYIKVYEESSPKPRGKKRGMALAAVGISLVGFCVVVAALFLLLEGTLEIPVPPRPGFSSQISLSSNIGF
ncbi:hypothetical protein SUGI_0104610 [Cryptomeria japonica]|nr:hypothetical protein SUGI_0104610 [Cryptomeria japonica]